MAAKEIRRDHITKYCLFAIDDANDISVLPTSVRVGSGDLIRSATCCIGSRAIAVSGKIYMLNGSDQWVEYNHSGGSSGGSEPGEYDYITNDEIDNMFNH